jgi:hypothetical protein
MKWVYKGVHTDGAYKGEAIHKGSRRPRALSPLHQEHVAATRFTLSSGLERSDIIVSHAATPVRDQDARRVKPDTIPQRG